MEIYKENYTVYYHENRINNKKYIGITKQKCKRRWGKEGHGYKTCTYFYHAIEKYGWKNFEHVIIATNLTKNEAYNFEKILIRELDTTNSKKGYNIAVGG